MQSLTNKANAFARICRQLKHSPVPEDGIMHWFGWIDGGPIHPPGWDHPPGCLQMETFLPGAYRHITSVTGVVGGRSAASASESSIFLLLSIIRSIVFVAAASVLEPSLVPRFGLMTPDPVVKTGPDQRSASMAIFAHGTESLPPARAVARPWPILLLEFLLE